jgi:predicted heme/steroid binding protein
MKKLTLVLWCLFLTIAVCSSTVYSFIYDIDEVIQFNGTNTFTDTFLDGAEPPSGPLSGSDYVVAGSFGTNRENGGLLELNSADGIIDDNEFGVWFTVDNSDYFITDGTGGYLSGSFEINDGLWNDSHLDLHIDNDAHSGPTPTYFEDAYIGIYVDSNGRIYAVWGNFTWDGSFNEIDNNFSQDITDAFGSNTKITMELSLDTLNQVTAKWDFGSDDSFDLIKSNFSSMDLTLGNYSGTFSASQGTTEDLIIDFGDSVGLWMRNNDGSWEKLHSSSAEIIATGDIDASGEDDVIIDFGPGIGIYVYYNNATWSKLQIMTTEDIDGDNDGKEDVIIDFGPGIGIYVYYNNTTWSKLHNSGAEIIAIGDMDGNGLDDVIIDFGAGDHDNRRY